MSTDLASPDTSPVASLVGEPSTLGPAEHYRSVFNAMLNGLAYCKVLTDGPPPHDFVYIEVNQAFEDLTGLRGVAGRKVSEVIPGIREEDPWLLDTYGEVARTGRPQRFERYVRALGDWFAVSVYCPAPGYFVAVFDVTTKRKVAEEALRVSEDLFRTAFENSSMGIAMMAPDGHPIRVNRTLCEMLGYDAKELLAASWRDLTHPDDVEATARGIEDAARNPLHGARMEKRYVRKDGTELWADVSTRAVIQDGVVRHFVSTVIDITERRQAHQAQAASEARYRALFGAMRDGLAVVDMDGTIRDFNEAYQDMLGYSAEELRKMTYVQLTPERWHAMEARIVREEILPLGFSGVYEKEYRRKDGTLLPVELRTILLREDERPVGMCAIVRNVAEVRALQGKLAMASRLAALGTLVSGVAHEINNPLAAEMADQGMALEVVREVREHLRGQAPVDGVADVRALDGAVEALEDARESAERIARVVKDLALFGKPDAKRQRARLRDIVDGAMRWLPPTVGGIASVKVEDLGAPDVVASTGQIEQVVVNLVTNAAKAMPDGRRDPVVVRIGPGDAGMARVEVVDRGVGIDPAIHDRIFDPFFTTRPTGPRRGSGLGLAICQSIATAHGGALTFRSEVGKGSTFQLDIPAAPGEG